ncbi:glutamyl-tRNA amidotransferase [Helicobacter pylori]|nr:glutamyl-tRNA amidotransferase [Helicobacter pylori]OKB18968.1 glutamyl-tRNA amidotransferase [Helicobacter pylori]OKB20515.1 glutamyl-tRNA amidotransferase [Helicobacter pylori]
MFGGIVKIFDLFVIGGCLALDFVNNFTNGLKDFLSGLGILLWDALY